MNIAIVSNRYKDPRREILGRVSAYLGARGHRIVSDLAEPERLAELDLMISVGGDGTFLNAVRALQGLPVPVVGINAGSVGFLTEITVPEIEPALARILAGDYEIEARMLLRVAHIKADGRAASSELALNEALLSRGSQRIIPVELYFDGRYIETIRCDGLLVSTPTGSTGYAMAAGGPISHPDLDLMQVTPICPYSMQNRSYLLCSSTVVELRLAEHAGPAMLSVDGRSEQGFGCGDAVRITRAVETLRRLRLNEQHFFEDLPGKLLGRSANVPTRRGGGEDAR